MIDETNNAFELQISNIRTMTLICLLSNLLIIISRFQFFAAPKQEAEDQKITMSQPDCEGKSIRLDMLVTDHTCRREIIQDEK